MIYRLIALNGPLKGQRITVDPEPMTIGRDESCSIALPDNEAALQHARLEHRDTELFIHTLGAINKVIVNKREIKDTRLQHGDIIELGRTRFLVEANVLADVQSAKATPGTIRRRGRKRKLAAGLAALLVAGSLFALIRPGHDTHDADLSLVDNAVVKDEMFPDTTAEETVSEITSAQDPDHDQPENANQPIDAELQQIREDLLFIQQHIESLNKSSAMLADDNEQAAPSKPVETSINDIESVMIAVRTAMDATDYTEADELLGYLELEHPDYLPAYQTRAELYEIWGMPDKAREQWSDILQRATESDLYRKAVVERIRLGRLESQQLISAHEAVRINSIEQVRFRETTEYDEMRLVKVHLVYDRSLGPIDPNGIRLLVYFFERDLDTQRIELSKLQPFKETRLSEMENVKIDQFTQSISYVVPKGYYKRDHHTSRQRYYGFIARLHYFDRLVDEQARPPKLLEPAILESAGLALHTADNLDSTHTLPAPLSN